MSAKKAPKISVLFASSLKPILDSRSHGRLGLSLRETNKYELNFIGFSSKRPSKTAKHRFFVSITDYHSRWQRLFFPWRFAYLLLKIKPKILICSTWEILPVAKFLKGWMGYKLIYDVQENYVENLKLNPGLSSFKRALASKLIRFAQKPSSIDYFLLAEACYAQEMPDKKPYLILENKYLGIIEEIQEKSYSGKRSFNFLITGTLSPAYGTREGIDFFKNIVADFPNSTLTILGHVPIKSFEKELQEKVKNTPSIFLHISENPIPHLEIIEALKKADFLLLPYEIHPAIQRKIPSKLFEANALGCPVIISSNQLWEEWISGQSSGISINFSNLDQGRKDFLKGISKPFFTTYNPEQILWKKEGNLFRELLDRLLA
ncbi:MAG: glycosyltransferase [Algoriphagus sp.]|uniref:glycosyltransferase n=1 Tax=Algoriphagus sp. TaxID=1872435 RepID=UPI00181AF4B1|nr:glycosyltransferase [Algoriphagus sp.]NVJ87610.1 glycosyltransferase [Algoriphagus sp.]